MERFSSTSNCGKELTEIDTHGRHLFQSSRLSLYSHHLASCCFVCCLLPLFSRCGRTDCPWLLQRPRITPIIDDPNSREHKYILLAFTSMSELSSTLPPETLSLLVQEKAVPVLFTHKLTYEYHTADYCLRKLLPAHIQIPSGFETVGHIAHLNLSEEQRPYGKLIAKVLLDVSQIVIDARDSGLDRS